MRRRPAILALALAALLMPEQVRASEPPVYSDAAFTAVQKAGGTIVLETWAPWCLPCQIQAPIMERLKKSAEFRSMRILRVGEETPPTIWQRFRLTGYGMIVVFKNGKEVARGTPTSEKALVSLIRSGL